MAARQSRRHGLYLITPDEPDTARLLAAIAALPAEGVALLQYRNKLADAALREAQAAALLSLCRSLGIPLLINDDLELALHLGADGVHLGRDDGDFAAARQRLAPGMMLGVSCYADWERACTADRAGADYVAFGAMFPSSTKPLAPVAPQALLGRARSELSAAVACIGGVTLARAPALLAAGAQLLAVISDVFSAPDPSARVCAYRQILAAGTSLAASPLTPFQDQ